MDYKVIKYFNQFLNILNILQAIIWAWCKTQKVCQMKVLAKPPATSDDSLNPRLDYFDNSKFQVEFDGSCLKPDEDNFWY